jgi:hypothetical protein
LDDAISFSMKTRSFEMLKEQKAHDRIADLRQARRGPKEAAKIQRRVSLAGNVKWQVMNLSQVARAIAKWR